MKSRLMGLGLWFLVCATATARPGWTYDISTHKMLAEKAAEVSRRSDDVLKKELGFPEGRDTKFLEKTVTEWVGEGAGREDDPELRVLNHFHDPLAPWDEAGLRVILQLGQSSVLWQQNPAQDSSTVLTPFPRRVGGGNWSWQDTRERYRQP
jgi:hypothetical protein